MSLLSSSHQHGSNTQALHPHSTPVNCAGGSSTTGSLRPQRDIAEALIARFEVRPQLQGGLEGILRLLLIADLYSVTLLRDHCLHRLAARFNTLASNPPQHERALFDEFLLAVAPKVRGTPKGIAPSPLGA